MAYSGKYRGTTFRSILELSVIRNLEENGLVLGTTMLYEATRIKYGKTKVRTYVVDLTLPDTKTLIEVKPSSRADNKNNTDKRKAAERWCLLNGWTYVIVTEEELRQAGHTVTLEEAAKMEHVVLNERALRANRRKMARRKRKTIRKVK
jgi:glutathione synthase/RimK-type ligase-like ATP-grasp enzyme